MSTAAPPVAYTTSIEVSKTIGEIQEVLARHGASRIAVEYENKIASGITFALTTEALGTRLFELPVDIDAMHRKMIQLDNAGEIRNGSRELRRSREQAARVAWRVIKQWITSQLSLLETDMISLEQTMFAFLKSGGYDSPTIYQAVVANPNAMKELER